MSKIDCSDDTSAQDRLFAIVMAAGESSRFGSTKQLAEFGGVPLVVRAMRLATELFGERCILVAGNDWRAVAGACKRLPGFLVVNTEFKSGMGSSIAAGVAGIAETATGALLLLADQPLIDTGHLCTMVSAWLRDPQCIVASEFDHTEGPPVIFPAACFDALMALDGERGAREILQGMLSKVVRIPCANAAIDIDSPADLESLDR